VLFLDLRHDWLLDLRYDDDFLLLLDVYIDILLRLLFLLFRLLNDWLLNDGSHGLEDVESRSSLSEEAEEGSRASVRDSYYEQEKEVRLTPPQPWYGLTLLREAFDDDGDFLPSVFLLGPARLW